MAPKKYKCWVNTRVEDWAEGGALQLGQVLKDPLNPNSACIPAGSILPTPEGSVEWSKRVNVVDDTKDEVISGFKAWLKFFNLPFGTVIEMKRNDSSKDTRHFKSLQAGKAIFDADYVQSVLDTKYVKTYMKYVQSLNFIHSMNKHLWMITGIRVVSGTTRESIESRGHNTEGEGSVDTSAASVPLQVSVGAHYKSTHEHSQSSGEGTDYVFQYRIEKSNTDFNLTSWNKGHSETTDVDEEDFDFELIANEQSPFADEDLEKYCTALNPGVKIVYDEQEEIKYLGTIDFAEGPHRNPESYTEVP